MNYILPILVAALCGISLLLLLRDRKDHPFREENKIEDLPAPTKVERAAWVYSVILIAITLGSSVLFCTVYKDNNIFISVKRLTLLSVIWPIAYIDYKTYRIPNSFILYGLLCRVALIPFELLFASDRFLMTIIGEAVAAGGLLLACLLCTLCMKGAIGFGDMKLFIVMGLLLGLDAIWSAIFVSLLISFVLSIVLLLTKKKTRKDAIPFGPAIVVGTFISVCLTGM